MDQRGDLAVSGWRSDFAPAPVQLRRQWPALLALTGRRLQAAWTGWDATRNVWEPFLPLVLAFDGGYQLELAWQAWDDLSVTWGTIDPAVPPVLAGRPHEWRSSPPLAAVVGRVLTGWAVTESPYFPGEADLTGALPMDEMEGWFTQGLWIQFGGAGLHVYNGADATRVSNEPVCPGDGGHTRVVHRRLPEGAG